MFVESAITYQDQAPSGAAWNPSTSSRQSMPPLRGWLIIGLERSINMSPLT